MSPGGEPEGALFEATEPWGPWHLISRFPAGYIASIIPKQAGADDFYFTAAGGTVDYNLHIGRIRLRD